MDKKGKKPHKKKPRSANKLGRNKVKAERYERQSRREANRDRRAARIRKGFRRTD